MNIHVDQNQVLFSFKNEYCHNVVEMFSYNVLRQVLWKRLCNFPGLRCSNVTFGNIGNNFRSRLWKCCCNIIQCIISWVILKYQNQSVRSKMAKHQDFTSLKMKFSKSGAGHLLKPLANLFNMVLRTRYYPPEWS